MKNLKSYLNRRNVVVLTAAALIIIGGIYFSGSKASQPSAQAPQAIPVVVQTLKPEKTRVWTEFSGRLHAVDSAEIRPEVSGKITKILFQDGQNVKQGDTLFIIEPRPYEAALAKAQANLATAVTNANFAKTEFDRATGMLKTQAIAQRVYDERANSNRVADASVKAAQAEVKQAQVNLEYAYVKAPISGRVGRAEITVGNLVQAGPGAPLLTAIVANNDIYADFEVDEQTYMNSVRNYASKNADERKIPVELHVQGDKDHPYKGTIYSFDNRIDATSGTIRARAKFNNADGALIPGMFVSVSLAGAADSDQILVPERAVSFDQNKKFVYLVGEGNKVVYREVELGKQVGPQRIVIAGLQSGDRVIVDGIQHVKPDAVVDAKEVSDANAIVPAAGSTSVPDKTPAKK